MDIKEYTAKVEFEKQNHPWEYARFNVVSDILKRNLKPKNNVIFDVGCGDGFFLEKLSLQYKNMRFVAVDTAFDFEMISYFSDKFKKSNVEFYKEMPKKVDGINGTDVVLLLDVIEHIENDIDFLKKLSIEPIISNDTLFMITVPAYQKLFCSHDFWLGHYRRYTTKKLQKNANNAGLEVIESGYFFSSLLLPRFAQVLIEKISKPDIEDVKGIGDWKGSSLKTKIIKSVLVCDYRISRFFRLIGIRLPGLSCYAVCKKQ